jgi:hypothetical protein
VVPVSPNGVIAWQYISSGVNPPETNASGCLIPVEAARAPSLPEHGSRSHRTRAPSRIVPPQISRPPPGLETRIWGTCLSNQTCSAATKSQASYTKICSGGPWLGSELLLPRF